MRFFLAWFLMALSASGQSNDVFRAQTRLVVVPVTVTSAGKFVDGLEPPAFQLLDNGVPQQIEVRTADAILAPIAIAVVIQTNSLAKPALAKITRVGSMIEPLITGERGRAAVISFDSEVKLVHAFDAPQDALANVFRSLTPAKGPQARLRDAVHHALELLDVRPVSERKAILLISETRDRGSETELAHLVETMQRSPVTLYAASFSAYRSAFAGKPTDQPSAGGMNILAVFRELGRLGALQDVEALTEATGGWRQSFTRLQSLEKQVSALGEELHAQYQITYTPSRRDPGYHRIAVRIAGEPAAIVRARPGYWAAAE